MRCVAVPVMHPTGRFAAALSVVGTTEQIPLDSSGNNGARQLKQTAKGFSGGCRPKTAVLSPTIA